MFNLKTGQLKKALVVDDSAFMRKLISGFINAHPDIEVIATARNGRDAIEKIQIFKPDVVTLDIEMPVMNGLEALKEIMLKYPVPVVMLSSTTKIGAENTMLAMEYGAVDFVAKPGGAISLNLHEIQEELLEKVAAAIGVQVAKLKTIDLSKNPKSKNTRRIKPMIPEIERKRTTQFEQNGKQKFSKNSKTFVMIGTSTGGPRALQAVLTKLPKDIGAPILIVQHMPPGFTKSLAERLDGLCEINVKEAEDGDQLVEGTAYIAPGGKHLKINKFGRLYVAKLDQIDPPRAGHRPAVDVLFESAAKLTNVNCLAVVMTGMGYDGKNGMKYLKEKGQTISIAESIETSVVYGMPRAIVEANLADSVVNLEDISRTILENLEI